MAFSAKGLVASWFLANLLIWGAAVAYIRLSPYRFASEWTVLLPPSSPKSDISLANIGQAQVDSGNAFGIVTLDPRESYKLLFMSGPVIEPAARKLGIRPDLLQKSVKITLPSNTGLIEYHVTSSSPEAAQRSAEVLYQAFMERINALRAEELTLRNQATQQVLTGQEDALANAQEKLAQFKAVSGLVSADQLNQVAGILEELRRESAETKARASEAVSRQQRLSATLALSPEQANQIFLLRGNQAYQESLSNYSKALADLSVLEANKGANHPSVKIKLLQIESARQTIEKTLGRPVDSKVLELLTLPTGSSGRENLLSDLISAQSQAEGLTAQAQELDRQITELNARRATLSRQAAELARLTQDTQTRQVVLSTSAGRLALSATDIPTSYPLIQLVIPPALPGSPTSPKPLYALVGAALATILVTGGLVIAWRLESAEKWAGRSASLEQDRGVAPTPEVATEETLAESAVVE